MRVHLWLTTLLLLYEFVESRLLVPMFFSLFFAGGYNSDYELHNESHSCGYFILPPSHMDGINSAITVLE